MPSETMPVGKYDQGWQVRDQDIEELLRRAVEQWKATDGTYNLGLTKFALVNLHRQTVNMEAYQQFMLAQALTYAYDDDQWWLTVRDPRERLAVSMKLLRKHNEGITGRIITHLAGDPNIGTLPAGLPDNMTTGLLETGLKTDNAFLRREIFDGLRSLTQAKGAWDGPSPLDADQSTRLGVFALEDSEFGDTTAELIGHLRSATAVRVLLDHSDDERKITALLLIQRAAGSLPAFVPGNLRLRLSAEWMIQRLIQEPVSLVSAYVLAFLGAALGVTFQVYLTYNLPDFMDSVRFTTSLVRGLIVGSVFGVGIFFIRVIMERFRNAPIPSRLFAATILGGLGLNLALLIFHVLFLNTPPHGLSITAACVLVALTFGVGGLLRSRPLKMTLACLAVFAAIVGTWWIHIRFAAALVDLTPVFRYDYGWTWTQVTLTALAVALPIGILGNMVNLSIVEE
jgi:hypothetical protein